MLHAHPGLRSQFEERNPPRNRSGVAVRLGLEVDLRRRCGIESSWHPCEYGRRTDSVDAAEGTRSPCAAVTNKPRPLRGRRKTNGP